MSSNCSCRCLKPAVAEFARLLAIVSRLACWALMPLAAVYRARIIAALRRTARPETRYPVFLFPIPCSLPLDLGQLLGRDLVEVGVEDRHRPLHHLGLALGQHQLEGSLHGVLVRSLDRPLRHCR